MIAIAMVMKYHFQLDLHRVNEEPLCTYAIANYHLFCLAAVSHNGTMFEAYFAKFR